jgi:hypothetical protein
MTPQEFEYIRRAMQAIESPDCTQMAKAKILQTMSEICGRNAAQIREQLEDAVDAKLARNYQDLQNCKLVDILSR